MDRKGINCWLLDPLLLRLVLVLFLLGEVLVFEGGGGLVCEGVCVGHDAPAVVDDAVFERVLTLPLEKRHATLVRSLDVAVQEARVVLRMVIQDRQVHIREDVPIHALFLPVTPLLRLLAPVRLLPLLLLHGLRVPAFLVRGVFI